MKNMDNTPERLQIIRQMNRILHHDAPWVFGLHPKSYTLGSSLAEESQAERCRQQHPQVSAHRCSRPRRGRGWPGTAGALAPVAWAAGAGCWPSFRGIIGYRRRERRAAVR
jgi:oligopeptide transport system substrate-binding protein